MVFISYSAKDKNIALEIVDALGAAGYLCWYFQDPARQPSKPEYLSELQTAIKRCQAFILLISKTSLESFEVRKEFEQAHKQKKPIIPVLIDMSPDEFEREPDESLHFSLGTDHLIPYTEKIGSAILARLSSGQEIEGFLSAKGFKVDKRPSHEMFLTVGEHMGYTSFHWFFCPKRNVGLDDVEALLDRLTHTSGSKGWIITSHAVDVKARKLVAEKSDSLQIATLAEFYRVMAQYDDYLGHLTNEVESDISPYWVDLHCNDEEGGLFKVEEYVDSWLKNSEDSLLALMGIFGMGKTWFCKYYAAKLAQQHLKDAGDHRIPILISLSDWKEVRNIEAHIQHVLTKSAYRDVGNYEAFMHLNRCGRLLLIFDGFEDMEERVEERVAMENFKRIAGIITEKSKVILTSRQLFFEHLKPLKEIMEAVPGGPRFKTLTLQEFDDDQIRHALQKRIPDRWEYWWNQISVIDRLKDVASRPVMIEVISKASPQIEIGRIDSATLYRSCITEGWIKQACRVDDEQTVALVYDFVRGLACEMFTPQADRTIAREEFHRRAGEIFSSPELTKRLTDLLVLHRQTGKYTFSHLSFMEFLVADRIAEELSHTNGKELFSYRITEGVVEFLKEIASSVPGVLSGILQVMGDAQLGNQISVIVQILKALGGGNPILPVINALNASNDQTITIPLHVVTLLGREEYLNDDNVRLTLMESHSAWLFWADLWGSQNVGSERALEELGKMIHSNIAITLRRRAAIALGRRQGEQESRALIEAIGKFELPIELRKTCISSISDVALKDKHIWKSFFDTLSAVIFSSQDDLSFKKECLIRLGRSDSPEVTEALLAILRDYRQFGTEEDLWTPAITAISQASNVVAATEIENNIIPKVRSDDQLESQIQAIVIRLLFEAANSIIKKENARLQAGGWQGDL
jgi:hypothetical protein